MRNLCCLIAAIVIAQSPSLPAEELVAKPTARLVTADVKDQDDMCVWVHPSQPDQSLVIASDKSAGAIFVYDLDGQLRQQIAVTKPGNIDLRQGIKLGDRSLDLVVVNQRADGFKLRVFSVDLQTRQLTQLDNGDFVTGPNYGGCLYHSAKASRTYFICTSETGTVEQHELLPIADGRIGGRKVRDWSVGKCEGAVADDETASLYISEETKGVWRFPADPDEPASGTLIAKIGEHGLKGDVEGLAIHRGPQGTGLLVVSDQGNNRFAVYERQKPHSFVGHFSIEGASQTDGVEICLAKLGSRFPHGVFACHTDQAPRAILLTPWEQIGSRLPVKTAAAP